MRLLLDTHAYLWWLVDDDRLPGSVHRLIEDPSNMVAFSVCTVWELVTKETLGRLRLPEPAATLVRRTIGENSFQVVPVELRHALRVSSLPALHADPFDRMLVAQALEEGLTIVTGDRAVQAYPVDFVW